MDFPCRLTSKSQCIDVHIILHDLNLVLFHNDFMLIIFKVMSLIFSTVTLFKVHASKFNYPAYEVMTSMILNLIIFSE